MPCDVDRPDLAAVLPLDMGAPRAARRRVALVDGPMPDLREELLGVPVVAAPETIPPSYSGVLVERLADRWHTETDGSPGALWFEIDRRRPTSGVSRSGPAGRAE